MQNVQIPKPGWDFKKVFLIYPSEKGIYPAVVYMPGGAVREKGNPVYRQNGDFFDIDDKIANYFSMGVVVLAPLRNTVEGCCNGDDAIKEGIRIAKAAAKYLNFLQSVQGKKMFSGVFRRRIHFYVGNDRT
jgi:hypothetical protein